MSGVCCEIWDLQKVFLFKITNISVNWVSFSVSGVRSDVGLLAQSLHTLYVVLHGGAVCDLSGTVGRKPASLAISHPLSMTPAYSERIVHWPNSSRFTCIHLVSNLENQKKSMGEGVKFTLNYAISESFHTYLLLPVKRWPALPAAGSAHPGLLACRLW